MRPAQPSVTWLPTLLTRAGQDGIVRHQHAYRRRVDIAECRAAATRATGTPHRRRANASKRLPAVAKSSCACVLSGTAPIVPFRGLTRPFTERGRAASLSKRHAVRRPWLTACGANADGARDRRQAGFQVHVKIAASPLVRHDRSSSQSLSKSPASTPCSLGVTVCVSAHRHAAPGCGTYRYEGYPRSSRHLVGEVSRPPRVEISAQQASRADSPRAARVRTSRARSCSDTEIRGAARSARAVAATRRGRARAGQTRGCSHVPSDVQSSSRRGRSRESSRDRNTLHQPARGRRPRRPLQCAKNLLVPKYVSKIGPAIVSISPRQRHPVPRRRCRSGRHVDEAERAATSSSMRDRAEQQSVGGVVGW